MCPYQVAKVCGKNSCLALYRAHPEDVGFCWLFWWVCSGAQCRCSIELGYMNASAQGVLAEHCTVTGSFISYFIPL